MPTSGLEHGLSLAPSHLLPCTLVLLLPPRRQSVRSKSVKKLCLLLLLKNIPTSRFRFSFLNYKHRFSFDHFSVSLFPVTLYFPGCLLFLTSISYPLWASLPPPAFKVGVFFVLFSFVFGLSLAHWSCSIHSAVLLILLRRISFLYSLHL